MTDKGVQTCKECVHFYVTYDANFPYGCKAMDFKSLRYPYFVVQDATGDACQMRCIKASGKPSESEPE